MLGLNVYSLGRHFVLIPLTLFHSVNHSFDGSFIFIYQLIYSLIRFLLFQVLTPDQVLQQVIILKKELGDLQDSMSEQTKSIVDDVIRSRAIGIRSKSDVEMELSKHRETVESLEMSETTVRFFFISLHALLPLCRTQIVHICASHKHMSLCYS